MQKNRNIVLAINDVEPGLVAAVKSHSKRLGRELTGIVLIDKKYNELPNVFRDDTGVFREIICDFEDPIDIQRTLKPFTDSLLLATCVRERSVLEFRKIVPFLPYINTPSESALLWSIEKHLMRDRLYGYDENLVPKYRYIEELNIASLDNILGDMEFPIIVKPNGLQASVLVSLCHDRQELETNLKHVFEVIGAVYSRDLGRGKPSVLLEEFIKGDMYSLDAFVNPQGDIACLPHVRVVTAHELGKSGFYGYLRVVPADLTDEQRVAGYKAAEDAIRAVNLRSSTAHIEMYLTDDGWKIIELGARIGGYREILYREAYGVDMWYNDLAARIDSEFNIPTEPVAHAAAINIYAEEEGVIESIEGFDEASTLPGILSLKLNAQPGDTALFAANGGKLIVDGIVKNTNPTTLEETVKKIRELIKINVRPTELIS